MAIQLLQGFNITSASPIDARFVLSKAQMVAMDDNLMPDKYFAICTDDNQIYYYDKTRPSSVETGKFEPITSVDEVVVRGYYLNGKFYTDSTYTVECPKSEKIIYVDENSNGALFTWNGTQFEKSVKDASSTVAGVLKLYQTEGENIDGAMSQKIVTEGIQSISFNIDSDDSECLILDLPWDDIHGRF